MALLEKQKKAAEQKEQREQDVSLLIEDAEKDPAVRARLAGSRRLGEMLKGYRSYKEVGQAFSREQESGEVELRGISEKKETVTKARENLSKRYDEFRGANKKTSEVLRPFTGKARAVLLEALDRDFNPVGYRNGHVKKNAADIDEVRGDFDRHVEKISKKMGAQQGADFKKNAAASAYLFLKEEKVFQAEDELNGGEKQNIEAAFAARVGERQLKDVLANHPALANSLIAVANERRLSEVQRLYGLKIVLDEFARDPAAGPALETAMNAWQKANESNTAFDLEHRARQRALRQAREAFKKAQELFGGDSRIEVIAHR